MSGLKRIEDIVVGTHTDIDKTTNFNGVFQTAPGQKVLVVEKGEKAKIAIFSSAKTDEMEELATLMTKAASGSELSLTEKRRGG